MAKIFEVPFAGGTILFYAPGTSGAQAFGADDVIQRAVDGFEDALTTIRQIGEKLANQLSTMKCDSAEASFGLTLTGTGKFVVAEASAQASLAVKLVFKGNS